MASVLPRRCGLFLTRNLLARTCAVQRVSLVAYPSRNLHAVNSWHAISSLPMPSARVFRSLFPLAGTVATNKTQLRHFGIEELPSNFLTWCIDKAVEIIYNIPPHVKLLHDEPHHGYQPQPAMVKRISEKIKKLQKQHPEDVVVTVYIKGKPGLGKVQLARHCAEDYYERLWPAWCILGRRIAVSIDTRNETEFDLSYYDLFLAFCGKCEQRPDNIKITDEVKEKLKLYPGWLLTVNVDAQGCGDYYKRFLPQPGTQKWGRGVVLVTTTDDRVIADDLDNRYADVFEMPHMTEKDAIALLKEISGCRDEEGAEKIKHIERSPDEVVKAGLRIKNKRSDPDTDTDDVIVKTAKRLMKDNPTLEKVFRLLAFCPNAPLPMSVIKRYLGVHADLDTVRRCELLAIQSYQNYESVFLPPITSKSHFVSAFTETDFTLKQEQVEKIVRCILEEYEEASQSSSVQIKHMLFPYMSHFWTKRTDLPPKDRLQLCMALGTAYRISDNNPKEAKRVLMTELEAKTSRTNIEKAKLYLAVGTNSRHLGEYKDCERYLTKALDLRNHLDVADILRELNAIVFSYGEYMENRQKLQNALEMYQETLEDDHPLVGETLCSLAYLCIKEGRWKKTESYLKDIEHQQYIPSNLAILHSELGNHDNVIHMLKKEEQGCTKHYGMSYPAALAMPLARLTAAYYLNGDWIKREESFQKMQSLMEQQVDIPLAALQVLGSTVCDFGDIPLAERLCHMMTKLTAGKTEDAQLLLGKLYRLIGNWNEAQEILETTLRRSEAAHRPDHLRVGKVLGVLGKVYEDQDLLTRSVVTYERALEIHTKVYGSQHPHPEVAFVLGDLGRVVQRTGDGKRGTDMMEEALNMWNRSVKYSGAFKSEKTSVHAMYSQMLSNYGILLRDTERLDEAESSLVNALRLQEKILAENSLPRLKTIYRLGTVWDRQGKRKEAQLMIKSVLDSLKVISPNHPYTAVVLTGMARCMENDTEAALKYLDQALDIRTKPEASCVDIHTLIAHCYGVRGETLRTQDPRQACQSFEQAIEVFGKLIEREQMEQFHVSSDSSIEVAVVNKWKKKKKSYMLET